MSLDNAFQCFTLIEQNVWAQVTEIYVSDCGVGRTINMVPAFGGMGSSPVSE